MSQRVKGKNPLHSWAQAEIPSKTSPGLPAHKKHTLLKYSNPRKVDKNSPWLKLRHFTFLDVFLIPPIAAVNNSCEATCRARSIRVIPLVCGTLSTILFISFLSYDLSKASSILALLLYSITPTWVRAGPMLRYSITSFT